MTVRNSRSRGTRSPRRRTLWVNLTPGSEASEVNDQQSRNVLLGPAHLVNFPVGGTILRTIIDIFTEPDIETAAAWGDGAHYMMIHFGLIMMKVGEVPDPNNPGLYEFMWTGSKDYNIITSGGVAATADVILFTPDEATHLRVDTTQRRRIDEGDELVLCSHTFIGGKVEGAAFGWIGKVLVGLP